MNVGLPVFLTARFAQLLQIFFRHKFLTSNGKILSILSFVE